MTMGTTMFRILMLKMTQKTTSGESNLARVLSVFDLLGLGFGSACGVGLYVIPGLVSKNYAGPGVIISVVIAAVAALISGLCYAEFAARGPQAGSAYSYTRIVLGEFIAFIVGWNLIMVYVLGKASAARSISGYIDSLANNAISIALKESMPLNADFISDYPDFLAFGFTLILSFPLLFKVKQFSNIMNTTAVVSLGFLIFTIITSSLKADIKNWQIEINGISENIDAGHGGFTPFGFPGIMNGAALYFLSFMAFDNIATTGEEAINPKHNIPLSSMVSLSIMLCGYFGISCVLTLMLPYYNQDVDVPLSYAFQQTGWVWAQWITSIGAVIGLSASFLGGMYGHSRLIYSMSSDGLLFKFMHVTHPKFKSPMLGTLSAVFLTGLMALIFDVGELINMMSIGTLLIYSVVAACVIFVSYASDVEGEEDNEEGTHCGRWAIGKQLLNIRKLEKPTKLSTKIVATHIIIYIVLCVLTSQLLIQARSAFAAAEPLAISGLFILVLCITIVLISIGRQPLSPNVMKFKVPFMPLIPAVGIFVNMMLMMTVDSSSWIKCGAWALKGLFIYFVFGFGCHYKQWTTVFNESPEELPTDLPQTNGKK